MGIDFPDMEASLNSELLLSPGPRGTLLVCQSTDYDVRMYSSDGTMTNEFGVHDRVRDSVIERIRKIRGPVRLPPGGACLLNSGAGYLEFVVLRICIDSDEHVCVLHLSNRLDVFSPEGKYLGTVDLRPILPSGDTRFFTIAHSRQLGLTDTSAHATLGIEVDEPEILNPDGSISRIPFVPVDDTTRYTSAGLVKLLQTQAVVLPVEQSTIRLKRSVRVQIAGQSVPVSLNTVLAFEVVSSTTGSVLSSQTAATPQSAAQNLVDDIMQFTVSNEPGGVKLRVHPTTALPNQGLRGYLMHVYRPDTTMGSLQRESPPHLASDVPSESGLMQNYPNPFNPVTRLSYGLKEAGDVHLVVYDILGRVVANLANGYHAAGSYAIDWDASMLASGVYFARITISQSDGHGFTQVRKMALMK